MKYYVNKENEVFAYETAEEMQEFSKEPLTEITEQQAQDLTKPTPEQLAEQAKAEALRYLADTDWYVVRLTETGVAIPEEVSIKRAEARAIL